MRVARVDVSRLDALRELPDGSIRVDARPTRAGILEYADGEGNTWREYRPPEEAFDPASLASLRGVTVTDGHPAGLVTAETWKDVAKGHAGDDVRRDGELVATSLVVRAADAVAAVKAGDRVDLSAGYECDVDPTPGVTPDGERYDAVQRNVRFNHVALLPRGEGRAGPACGLRLDGKAAPVARVVRADAPLRSTNPTTAATPKDRGMKLKIKVRGKEFRADDDAEMKQAQDAVDELEKKNDEAGDKHAELMSKISELMALVAQLQAAAKSEEAAEGEAPPADGDDAMAPEVFDSIARVRTIAGRVLGDDFKPEGKKPSELKRAVLAKLAPGVKLDAFDAKHIAAMFESAAAVFATRNDSLAKANEIAAGGGAAGAGGAVHLDSNAGAGGEPDADAAEARMRARSANAWKKGRGQ